MSGIEATMILNTMQEGIMFAGNIRSIYCLKFPGRLLVSLSELNIQACRFLLKDKIYLAESKFAFGAGIHSFVEFLDY
jgi:hypothetical protein